MKTAALLSLLVVACFACTSAKESAKEDPPVTAEAPPAAAATGPAPDVVRASAAVPAAVDYPATRRDSVEDTLHGEKIADPYRWLEDEKSPEVQAWMKAQDQAARANLLALPGRAALAKRLKELLYVESVSAP